MIGESYLIGIVDDDSSVRMALDSLVRSLGYRAILFASAEEYFAARMDGFDCLLCDVNLPGMSGWELVAWMRLNGPAIPTIIITAFSDTNSNASAVPGVKVFGKPFDASDMANAIREVLFLND